MTRYIFTNTRGNLLSYSKRLLFIFLSLVLILLTYYYYQFYYLKNFRVLIDNNIYRSGQPSAASMQEWQQKYGIKSLINLRGFDYTDQMKQVFEYADQNNIAHKTVRISSRRLPSQRNLNLVVDYILNSPKPLLIHCMRGVDRTGLFSSISLLLNNYSISDALGQMSLDKGFLPYRQQNILKVLIEDYANWLKQNRLTTNKDNFIYWARNIYQPLYYKTDIKISAGNNHSKKSLPSLSSLRINKNSRYKLNITIKNTSNYDIPFNLADNKAGVSLYGCLKKDLVKYSDRNCIHLYSYKRKPKGFDKNDVAIFEGEQLFYKLRPGKSIDLELLLPGIEFAGDYQLEVDLYDGKKAWFSEFDTSNSAKLNISVS